MLPPDYRLNREIRAADETNRTHRLDRIRDMRQSGGLLSVAEAGWDAARRAWNLAVDQRPRHVAFPASADDVVALVAYARANGLKIVPQGTGHGAAPIARIEESILVRPTKMRSIRIDATRGRARIEAGAVWGEVQEAAAGHGLAGLAGSSPEVGVLGYTLNGGLGWLGRRHGLACNSVVSFDVVTADGRQLTVDDRHEPDLFWALRGGGGGFGIVTAMELALHPAKELHAGAMFWPLDRAPDVLRAWLEWTATVPDTITSVGRLLSLPPDPNLPAALRGKRFVVVEAACLTSPEEGQELLRPLRALHPAIDNFTMVAPTGLGALHMDPVDPVPVSIDGWLLNDLTADAIDAVVRTAGADSGSALVSFEMRHLGGALGRDVLGAGALPSLGGKFATAAIGVIPDPAMSAAVAGTTQAVQDALRPWFAERHYANFARPWAPIDEFHSPETVARLERVKSQYDPDDLVHTPRLVPAT